MNNNITEFAKNIFGNKLITDEKESKQRQKARQDAGYIIISNDNDSHQEFPTTAFKKDKK